MEESNTKRDFLVEAKEKLSKEGYGIVGDHSAVKTCLWTRHAIRGEGGCWKEKFYGISSAGCCQMTPALFNCEHKCLHCWRNMDYSDGEALKEFDSPVDILDGIVKKRKDLLMGFKGSKKTDMKKFKEALEPKLYTMSLSGEPTLYPRIGELFAEIRKRKAVSFLVTNGMNSQVILNLDKNKGEFPTQITVSTNAPNEKLFLEWHRTVKENAWEEFFKTLRVIKKLEGKVRRVIRLTLVSKNDQIGGLSQVSNMEEKHVKEYANLIRIANPDFIHIKGFKSVGSARKRMGYDKQPWFDDIRDYSKKLEEELKQEDYSIRAEDKASCVVMLAKKGMQLRITEV